MESTPRRRPARAGLPLWRGHACRRRGSAAVCPDQACHASAVGVFWQGPPGPKTVPGPRQTPLPV
ncbi:MAG: hypothetical protein AVDCRST_MAG19-3832 [uncultured Thermomicrobiales bacterium]|uniref:Uncharacterized protein n=1 Tax=uncultured Thermomicrobiales bacterium TaxID=1645740 RepID=A0A6J4VKL8_9BACT|nr:MAG: hypothetical protein AVDCRST_MAG19-3832 [uncultured Thermomicrobiales bacterium]